MRVHFLAGAQPHFVNHLAPIYLALPDDIRGDFYTKWNGVAYRRAIELGIPAVRQRQFKPNELVVIASHEDYRATGKASCIYYNHGVGQTYTGDPKSATLSSYSGGKDRTRAILFLCPSERDAQVNRAAYPHIPAAPVGVPYLDQFSSLNRPEAGPICFSFHANILACSETRWSWPYFRGAVSQIAQKHIWPVLGHSHPRARRQLEPWYRRLGIPYEPDWWKVLAQARCYVIDNSSSGFEAAAIGIPTVWLNPPWYRKHIHHGLRFWDMVPGVQVDHPEDLESAINIALQTADKPVTAAYGGPDGNSLVDGHATERAVEAICQIVGYSTSAPNSLTGSSQA